MPDYRDTPEAVASLSPEKLRVTQQSATERSGTGEYLDYEETGTRSCARSRVLHSAPHIRLLVDRRFLAWMGDVATACPPAEAVANYRCQPTGSAAKA